MKPVLDAEANTLDQDIEETRIRCRDSVPCLDRWLDRMPLRELLHLRWEKRSRLEDIGEIIASDLDRLRSSPVEKSRYVLRLGYLAVALKDRYHRTLVPSDAAKCLYFERLALNICPEIYIKLRGTLHKMLALAYLTRSEVKNEPSFLNDACRHAGIALSTTEYDDLEVLATAANAFRQRYLNFWFTADLDTSIKLSEKVLGSNPPIDQLPGYLHNLSYSPSLRFNRDRGLEDLNRAIDLGTKALKGNVTAESFTDRIANISGYLETRFNISHDLADLWEAFTLVRDARGVIPLTSSRQKLLCQNMVHLLGIMYARNHILEDLNEAIKIGETGVKLKCLVPATQANLLHELDMVYSARYKRQKRSGDSAASLRCFEEALEIMESRPSWRMNSAG